MSEDFNSLSGLFGHLESGGRARLGDKIISFKNGVLYFSSRGHNNLFKYKAGLEEIINLLPKMRIATCNTLSLDMKLYISELDFLKGEYKLTEEKKEESDLEVDVVFKGRVYE